MEFLKLFLLPFAVLFGIVTWIRNKLFDFKILPSSTFNVPVISVGNLCAGGTGKTPHVEYLLRLFGSGSDLATLSRGYGRKTNGFRIGGAEDHAGTIGDEPAQFANKFPQITVAVDERRKRGMEHLLRLQTPPSVFILDDAFQHRYVKPGFSILLTDYHNLYTNNYMLPFGTLRESRSGAARADIIVVTKTPFVLSPIERQRIIDAINPKPHQTVVFSFIRYGELRSLWNQQETISNNNRCSVIMMVAGIANSYPMEFELKNRCNDLVISRYKDHHTYTERDFKEINQKFSDIYTRNKLLVTTEKDAMRMLDPKIRSYASQLPFYYLPIEIDFHNGDKQLFDQTLLTYARKN